jgi:hypothetical protein
MQGPPTREFGDCDSSPHPGERKGLSHRFALLDRPVKPGDDI